MNTPEKATAPQVLRVPGWEQSWLLHGFSSRTGGLTSVYQPQSAKRDLNLGFTASDTRENVLANRRLFLETLADGQKFSGLVTLRQIHSQLMRRVDAADAAEEAIHEGDGLMTNVPGTLIGIQTADCIPVLLVDGEQRAVAAFHAGWRGTVAGIVESGVARMRQEFGSRPEALMAAIGPGIGPCCYAVGREVRQKFEAQFAYAVELFRQTADSVHLDLGEANRRQLLAAGLQARNIYRTGACTGCHTDRFFSHRAEHGFTGRMMSVIGVAGL